MLFCRYLTDNYWIAIVLFTFLTKIILFPLSLWCHKNSLEMVSLMPEINRIKTKYFGDKDRIAEETSLLFKKEGYHPLLTLLPLVVQIIILMGLIKVINSLAETNNLTAIVMIPIRDGGWFWFVPCLAGASAAIFGWTQNRLNPLQREQSFSQQFITNGISISISLFLGIFVAAGVGLYWIASNIFSILVQVACNAIIPPKKYINYYTLRRSSIEHKRILKLGKMVISKEDKKREKADYKRFFSVANKHLVFYSEASGFYKYFSNIIEYLLANSNIIIHYVTSDPKDQIFEIANTQPRIRPYFIGEMRLITLFMKMDADMVIMTTPDLGNFHLKRSYVRKDIEYIYLFHGPASIHLVVREGAYNNFDTLFCVGQHQIDELRVSEKTYKTRKKNLIPCGYPMIDDLFKAYSKVKKQKKNVKTILIAPSYQKDNIMDSCLDPLLEQLLKTDYRIIVRPHPQYIKCYPAAFINILKKYENHFNDRFLIESDFVSNESVFTSDLLITDWSGIAYEFSYTTRKPSLFINTPMKIINRNYQKLGLVPLDISLRDQIGVSCEMNNIPTIIEKVEKLIKSQNIYQEKINEIVQKYLFNPGESGKVGARYIFSQLMKHSCE